MLIKSNLECDDERVFKLLIRLGLVIELKEDEYYITEEGQKLGLSAIRLTDIQVKELIDNIK